MNAFPYTTVTIEANGQSVTVNTTDAEAALAGVVPSAVEECRIRWGQPSGRDHADPGSVALSLIVDRPIHPVITYGAQVTVMTRSRRGAGAYVVGHGWIQTIQTRRRVTPDTTTWLYQIDVADIIAKCAATKIGADPWPTQQLAGRLAAINDASPFPVIPPSSQYPENAWESVVAQDVDNYSLLDAIQESVAAQLWWVYPGAGRVAFRKFPLNRTAATWADPSSTGALIPLAPRYLSDADRTLSRESIINRVTVRYYHRPESLDWEETESVFYNPTATGSTSEVSLSTRATNTGDTLGRLREWAQTMFLDRPEVVLDPIQLLLSHLPDTTGNSNMLRALTELDRPGAHTNEFADRTSVVIKIDPTPDGLWPYHRLIGGELILHGDPAQRSLSLDLEPSTLSGQRPLMIDDFDPPRLTGSIWATIDAMNGTIDQTEMSTIPPSYTAGS